MHRLGLYQQQTASGREQGQKEDEMFASSKLAERSLCQIEAVDIGAAMLHHQEIEALSVWTPLGIARRRRKPKLDRSIGSDRIIDLLRQDLQWASFTGNQVETSDTLSLFAHILRSDNCKTLSIR